MSGPPVVVPDLLSTSVAAPAAVDTITQTLENTTLTPEPSAAPTPAPESVKPADAQAQVVTPWDVQGSVSSDGKQLAIDYDKLIEQFGTRRVDEALLQRFERVTGHKPHVLLRRGVFFSHREFDKILDRYEQGKPFYLYTGRGPSSDSGRVVFAERQRLGRVFMRGRVAGGRVERTSPFPKTLAGAWYDDLRLSLPGRVVSGRADQTSPSPKTYAARGVLVCHRRGRHALKDSLAGAWFAVICVDAHDDGRDGGVVPVRAVDYPQTRPERFPASLRASTPGARHRPGQPAVTATVLRIAVVGLRSRRRWHGTPMRYPSHPRVVCSYW
ncbi:hypothetical protein PLICRDRAFT_698348 [Plicaturopsis crispa FD-325 SS-3]|nr:hypothetical protein PLICRDRAFT_698348 [Plicaturopsis crispa FD-325 SS-3]